MRKFLLFALFIVLIFASLAWGDASLYRGAISVGAVRTIESGSNFLVSVQDVARLFGFTWTKRGDELILTRSNTQLRVIANSAAAWRGFTLVPLSSSPVDRDGSFWVDTQSAIAIFQPSAGQGANNRLRFSRSTGNYMASTIANPSRRDLEFGKFDEPAPPPPPAHVQVPRQAPSPSPVQTPAPVRENKQEFITIPEPEPIFIPPAPVKPVAPVTPAQNQNQNPAPVIQPANIPAKPAKYETFRPEDSERPRGEFYHGAIKSIRWSGHKTSKRIRAVIDTEEGSTPQVYLLSGTIHALFESAPENIEGINSPYSNIQVKISRVAQGVDLMFTAPGFIKIDRLFLDKPRRLVFDFFFPEQMQLVRNTPENLITQTPSPSPAPIITTPAKPVTPQPVKIPDPVINDRPQQKLIIPTTPAPSPVIPVMPTPTPRKITGKKTIVIDPGHGGKDPGASDNGVVEKNVNLSVGLELEKALLARGFNVIMTRRTDVYLKLQERTDIANAVNADLFVSIHVNALPQKKSMTGFEIYIMALPTDKDAMNLAKVENREYVEGKGVDTANVDKRTEMLLRILGDMQQNNKISESTDFASALHRAGVRSGLPMRRVAQAPFFVLRGAGMPAVLLELGFVTNAIESQLLTRKDYQQKIAQAMTEGITNYLR